MRSKIGTMLILLALLISLMCNLANAEMTGWIEGSTFPLNNEHETYGIVEGYGQYEIEKYFVFANPTLYITDNIPEKVRHDRIYVTNLNLGIGYLSQVDFGAGYYLTKALRVNLLYRCQRYYTGYEGDWTGVQIRYEWK